MKRLEIKKFLYFNISPDYTHQLALFPLVGCYFTAGGLWCGSDTSGIPEQAGAQLCANSALPVSLQLSSPLLCLSMTMTVFPPFMKKMIVSKYYRCPCENSVRSC